MGGEDGSHSQCPYTGQDPEFPDDEDTQHRTPKSVGQRKREASLASTESSSTYWSRAASSYKIASAAEHSSGIFYPDVGDSISSRITDAVLGGDLTHLALSSLSLSDRDLTTPLPALDPRAVGAIDAGTGIVAIGGVIFYVAFGEITVPATVLAIMGASVAYFADHAFTGVHEMYSGKFEQTSLEISAEAFGASPKRAWQVDRDVGFGLAFGDLGATGFFAAKKIVSGVAKAVGRVGLFGRGVEEILPGQTRLESSDLIQTVASKRKLFFAEPGSDDYRFLEMTGSDAAAGGPENLSIIVRGKRPQKLTLIEEYLHGTQSKIWGDPDTNALTTAFREWHVRDFMYRHQSMFSWDEYELSVLESEKNYWFDQLKGRQDVGQTYTY